MSVSAKNKALLGKIEATPDTDSVPVPGTDAIRIESAKITPLFEELVNGEVSLTFGEGKSDVYADVNQFEVVFKVRSGGGLGVTPDYWPILFAAAHALTVNAGVSIVIDPITTGPDAARQTSSFYYYEDGLEYKMIGAAASALSIDNPVNGWITCKATLVAPYLEPTAVALPSGIVYQSSNPIRVSSSDVITDNAVGITVGSYSFDTSVAGKVDVQIGASQALVTGRDKPKISFTKRSLATPADFTRITALTEAAFSSVFGSAGNRFTLTAPKGQYVSLELEDEDLFNNHGIGLKLNETSGDDAYQIKLD